MRGARQQRGEEGGHGHRQEGGAFHLEISWLSG
jgi:hypothetical protein